MQHKDRRAFLLSSAALISTTALANIKMGGKRSGAVTPSGPTSFVIGAWAQPASSFANWQRRGINTQVSPAPDFAGDTAAAWFAAAHAHSQQMIVGGRYQADGGYPPSGGSSGVFPSGAPNHYATLQADASAIGIFIADEIDLNGPGMSGLDAEVTLARSVGCTLPVMYSLRNGTANAILSADPTLYNSDASLNWTSSDNYPGQGQEPYIFGDFYSADGFTGPFTTMSGHATRNFVAGPIHGVAITLPGRPSFQFISTSRVQDTGGVPYGRVPATTFRIQAWSSIINGVSGLICFATYSGSAGFIQDDTASSDEANIADLAAKVAILQSQVAGNVLMDTVNGGRRPYTLIQGAWSSGGTGGNPTWPTTQPSFAAPVGNQTPAWFEGCGIIVGGETYRLVLNLHDSLSKTLTYAPWGMSGVTFTAGQVMCFKASAPTVNIIP